MEPRVNKKADMRTLLTWMSEAQAAHSDWRKQSWEDWEFRDGHQWTRDAYNRLLAKSINPLTINRIFPIINLVLGYYIRNKLDIVAKGRTQKDSELSHVMTEAFAFVRDQNNGSQLLVDAFQDEITAGIGFLSVGKHYDPRRESVQWQKHPWYSIWWDPYASPHLDRETCRYMFQASWKNLEDVMMLFPEKSKELREKYAQLSMTHYTPDVYTDDQGTQIEEQRRYLSANQWVNSDRKRIRPVEMWYTCICKGLFAIMPDSRVIDLDTLASPNEEIAVVTNARELVTANVKKMRVATFVSDMLLQDIPTPYVHDQYPFVPFVGYTDRYNNPFGVPRQVKEQSMEVNKRRSMALSLINNRRVIMEEGAAKDPNAVYAEANRQDGLIILKKGMMKGFVIQELGDLASAQLDLMERSEREIMEIAGASEEALTRVTRLQSGVALDKKQDLSLTVTASLLDNARHAHKRLGELTMAMVQKEWNGPKVLRVTDRLSGSEKFVEINQKVYGPSGAIEIRNNLTEAAFDIVVANAPITDTVREKNMELLFAAVNKAPPEAVAPLLNMAFEISDIPNKDALLKQIRMATGQEAFDPDLSKDERDAILQQQKDATQVAQDEEAAYKRQERDANISLAIAKAEKLRSEAAQINKQADLEDWEIGAKLGQEILKTMEAKA